ncbi:SGNH/GDSL hydrolase family protein [Pontibacter sp. E15-1]|uniref:SGNH/GDSL hydrolase family protein n=1 Tax=Pontibacter sp. E15-1 TaxID=2919918 RepID=UPI001F501DC6|nr:SGNH/GDSL hydrolase family protein [Pontibacter sp. E15-1]MCJ8165311.1 SGNH/GDSL hydrolase family protein [Pontibacter sp. E15-1]
MNSYFLNLLLLMCLNLAACKQADPEPAILTPADESSTTKTYLALGDSYTIGQSVPEADQWGRQLVGLLRAEGVEVSDPVTIARTGWTTSELAAAIKSADLKATFDLVTLLIGVNNQYRGQSLANYRTEFNELLQTSIRLAKRNPQHVLVLSIPDWGATPYGRGQNRQQITAEIDAFNAAAKDLSEQAGVTFINITPLTREAVSDLTYVASDGLHYSGKMHREWALRALPKAKEILK